MPYILQDDPATGVRVTPESLFTAFQRLTDENVKVGGAQCNIKARE